MLQNRESISFGKDIPDQALRNQYFSVSVTPKQAPNLGFRLALPRTWTQADNVDAKPIAFGQLSILAAFAKSKDIGVQVLATQMPWEVNLIDWLEYYAYEGKLKIVALQSGETDYGQMVHAAATDTGGAHFRLMVTGDGPTLVLLAGRMPASASQETRQTLGLAAASFQFLDFSGKKTREALELFRDKDGLFEVLHPESWRPMTLDGLRPAKGGVDLRARSDKNVLAYMRVEADTRLPVSETGLDKFYSTMVDEINEAGVHTEKIEHLPGHKDRPGQERYIGTCALPSGKGTIALVFQPARKWWIAAAMLCPDKTADPYAWMRGKRAYEIAVVSLQEPAAGASRPAKA